MNSKFNELPEQIDDLPLEEQEQLIVIEQKRNIEDKRISLLKNINEAQADIKNGNYLTGENKEVMKAIDDEVKSNKKI